MKKKVKLSKEIKSKFIDSLYSEEDFRKDVKSYIKAVSKGRDNYLYSPASFTHAQVLVRTFTKCNKVRSYSKMLYILGFDANTHKRLVSDKDKIALRTKSAILSHLFTLGLISTKKYNILINNYTITKG